VPEAAPVLYLALEGNRTAIRTRTGAIARGLTSTRRPRARAALVVIQAARFNLSDPAWTDELAEHVAESSAKLIVVDVLRKAHRNFASRARARATRRDPRRARADP